MARPAATRGLTIDPAAALPLLFLDVLLSALVVSYRLIAGSAVGKGLAQFSRFQAMEGIGLWVVSCYHLRQSLYGGLATLLTTILSELHINQLVSTASLMITLAQYINHRLGATSREQAINFLGKPFGARSPAEFWQYWNPVWSYFLLFYCYRLLRRNLPRGLSVVLTFFFCGLLHDLPFGILSYSKVGRPPFFTLTAFLTLNGLLVVLSEKARFRLTRIPTGFRWLAHVTILTTCYLAALRLTTWIAVGQFRRHETEDWSALADWLLPSDSRFRARNPG